MKCYEKTMVVQNGGSSMHESGRLVWYKEENGE